MRDARCSDDTDDDGRTFAQSDSLLELNVATNVDNYISLDTTGGSETDQREYCLLGPILGKQSINDLIPGVSGGESVKSWEYDREQSILHIYMHDKCEEFKLAHSLL
jgi:hypothetical protein